MTGAAGAFRDWTYPYRITPARILWIIVLCLDFLVCVGSMCVARGFYLISIDSSLRLPPSHARDVTGSTVHLSLGFIVWCLDLLWSVSDYVCGERILPERYRKLSLFPHIRN